MGYSFTALAIGGSRLLLHQSYKTEVLDLKPPPNLAASESLNQSNMGATIHPYCDHQFKNYYCQEHPTIWNGQRGIGIIRKILVRRILCFAIIWKVWGDKEWGFYKSYCDLKKLYFHSKSLILENGESKGVIYLEAISWYLHFHAHVHRQS